MHATAAPSTAAPAAAPAAAKLPPPFRLPGAVPLSWKVAGILGVVAAACVTLAVVLSDPQHRAMLERTAAALTPPPPAQSPTPTATPTPVRPPVPKPPAEDTAAAKPPPVQPVDPPPGPQRVAPPPQTQAPPQAPPQALPPAPKPAPAAPSLKPYEVMEAQERLRDFGFNPGPLDGNAGPMTATAVTRYQEARGLPKTGRLDGDLLTQLRKDTAPPPAPSQPPPPPQRAQAPPPAPPPQRAPAPVRGRSPFEEFMDKLFGKH